MNKLNLFYIICLSIASYNVDAMSRFYFPAAMPWENESFEEREVVTTIKSKGNIVQSDTIPYKLTARKVYTDIASHMKFYDVELTVLSTAKTLGESDNNFNDIDGKVAKALGKDCNQNIHLFSKVVIPNSVTEIGARAFKSIPQIDEINIGSSVTNIAEDAFPNGISSGKDCVKIQLQDKEPANSPRIHKLKTQILKSFPNISISNILCVSAKPKPVPDITIAIH